MAIRSTNQFFLEDSLYRTRRKEKGTIGVDYTVV